MTTRMRPISKGEKFGIAVLIGLLAAGSWVGAIGCMSRPAPAHLIESDPPIHVVYVRQLDSLRPGMSRVAVEAKLGQTLRDGERRACEGGHIDAYELSRKRTMATEQRTEYLWFYFKDDALIRWGPPGDWPVIEKDGASEALPSTPAESTPTMTPSGVPYAPPK